MAKMRIVGKNPNTMIVQRLIKGEWVQEMQTYKLFEYMMQIEYPKFWEEYLQSGTDQSPEKWFWHYGEDERMQVQGDAYIYEYE